MRLPDLHVALVDDDDSVRRAVSRLLRVAGMEVRVYDSGGAFLDAVKNHLPECLILDLYMPSMSGLDVQSSLAARGLRVPIVFITAHDDPDAEQRALEAGAVAFLHKPFSEQQLLSAIEGATRAAVRLH